MNDHETSAQMSLILIIRVVSIGALVIAILVCFLVGAEHRPHAEIAPPSAPLGLRSVPVASGAIASGNGPPIWLG